MILDKIKVEVFIFKICINLLRRDFSKYYKYVIGLYFIGMFGIYKPLRLCYFYARYIDDVVDGDSNFPKEIFNIEGFLQYCKKLDILKSIKLKLLSKNISSLEIESIFESFYKSMIFDFYKKGKGLIYTKKELENIYLNSFNPVLQITLWCIDSKIDVSEICELSLIQGKVYSLNDYEIDFENGLDNKPKEYQDLSFVDWKKIEYENVLNLINILEKKKIDKQSSKLIKFILNPIKSQIKNDILFPIKT
jgi:hypothetical protein